MSGNKAERSKNDTWGEKELARYIGKEAKKRTADPYGSPKTLSKERTNKQSSSSSRRPKDSSSSRGSTGSKEHTGGKQPPKPSPATIRKPERSDPAKATDTKTAGSRSKEESSRHGADSHRDTAKQASSQDGSRKHDVKPSRGDLGGRSRQSGSKDADRKRTHKSTKPSGKKPKAGDDSRAGKERERERERERGKSHGKDKELKSGASKLQSVSGSSIAKSSHSREPGGPLSDGLDREKQKRSSDKKHTGREGDGDKDQHGGKIVVREDPPGDSYGRGGEVEEEEGMVVERVENGAASHKDSGAVGGPPAQPMVEVMEELVEEEYQYGDEFEDYEEDFEEELERSSESEGEDQGTPARIDEEVEGRVDLVEILQAIDAENKMVGLATGHEEYVGDNREQYHTEQPDNVPSAPPLEYSPGRRFVDFSSARQREVSQRVAKKTRKRGQELLTMIDLDIAVYDMFDLPPLSEYEVYIKNFGSDNTRQVSVQTGEDNSEREVQTDVVSCSDKWVQWPPEDLKGYGGPSEDEAEESMMERGVSLSGQSAVRLVAFLKSAAQVCSVLLEENLTSHGHGQVPSQSSQSRFPFCSSCLRIQPHLSLLEGRCPMLVQFCPSQQNLLLTAYSSPSPASCTEDETGLRRKGLLCVWNSREPSQPLQVLTCESTPTCCCFSPQKASLVFAGNEDGSVVLWDLREPLAMHKPPPGSPLASLNFLPRAPTFSTAGIPSLDCHKAPLVTIVPMLSDVEEAATSLLSHTETSDGEVTGLSFQLATLDGSGRLNIWVVVEIYRPDPHGSDSDLGLVPGGKVKLVKSASLDVCTPDLNSHSVASMVQVHCFHFHPTDTNHLYIGTDTGRVYHHTRYGKRPIPRYYLPESESNAFVCDVVSMSFCPWRPDHFLVGCSDGALQLYHIRRVHPLVCWPHSTGGIAIKSVQWAEHQPGVFLVQDCQSNIYLWDLLQNDASPTFKDQFKASITYSSIHGKSQPAILLAFTNGAIEVHHLKITSEHNRDSYLLNYFDNLV